MLICPHGVEVGCECKALFSAHVPSAIKYSCAGLSVVPSGRSLAACGWEARTPVQGGAAGVIRSSPLAFTMQSLKIQDITV